MRIVLVDPSRAVQRAMTRLIEADGHEVVAFADGLQAIDYITRYSDVRALITSTEPLNISGIALCAAANRLSGSLRALHIVLMSATDDYHLAVTALDNGADDFIHKPPNPDELRARLRLADRVTVMKQQLIEHATIDFLTGLLNRRAFFVNAEAMCHAAEMGAPLSAVLFDIDHFKQINDVHGHETGDRVLAAVAAEARAAEAVAGRLGGEEFCVIVQDDTDGALKLAAELRAALRALHVEHDGQTIPVTCSFGVAEWEAGDTIDRMLRRADVAMYEAKTSGRDCIVASDTFVLTDDHDDWRNTARSDSRAMPSFAPARGR